MSTDIFPAGITSPGNNTWIWTDTLPTALANLTAGTDLSCYFPAGEIEIGFDQARDDDTRGCDEATRESFGAITYTRDELVHIVDPQGAGTEPGNMAAGAVEANAVGYISLRMGVKHGTAPTAEHMWDIYMVTTGAEHITPLQAGKYVRRVKTSWTRVKRGVKLTSP